MTAPPSPPRGTQNSVRLACTIEIYRTHTVSHSPPSHPYYLIFRETPGLHIDSNSMLLT